MKKNEIERRGETVRKSREEKEKKVEEKGKKWHCVREGGRL